MLKSTTVARGILGLFGDRDQMPVERAIAELRSGRPVILDHKDRSYLTAPAESVSQELLAGFAEVSEAPVQLVLTPARLHALGETSAERPRAVAAGELTAAKILSLAKDRGARLDGCTVPADPSIDAAILLMRQALLLPAVLMAPISPAAAETLPALTVSSEAVLRYDAERAEEVRLVSRAPVPLLSARHAEFVVFRGGQGMRDQVAIVIDSPSPETVVPVRLHSACLTGDLFGSLRCDCGDQLRQTVKTMAEGEGGVLLYLDQEGRGNGIASKMRAYALQSEGLDTYEADETLGYDLDARRFGFAASMLRQLGYTQVKLLTNNPEKIAALQQAGIDVVETQRIYGRKNRDNVRYLAAKQERAGHMIDPQALREMITPAAE